MLFSTETLVSPYRGSQHLHSDDCQDLPARLFLLVFPGYWSYYLAPWVAYLFFMEAVSILKTCLPPRGRSGRASCLPSAPTWLGEISRAGTGHSISSDT